MRPIRRLAMVSVLAAAAGVVLLGVGADAAAGGGSSLRFERSEYLPGEAARASGIIGITNYPGAGWIDDGPYYGYVIESDRYSQLSQAAQQWPFVPPEATRVGEVRSVAAPACCSAMFTLEFVVPSLPRGVYSLLICNEPCTATLGDFTGGGLQINSPGAPSLVPAWANDAAATPPPSAAPVSTPAATRTPDAKSGWWMWPAAIIAILGLGSAVVAVRRRTRPEREPELVA